MILVNAKITAKPGKKDRIIESAQNVIESTRQEPGCINYHLYANTEDENILMMLEKWETQEALDIHMKTDHFQAFGKAIEDLVAEELDIKVYTV